MYICYGSTIWGYFFSFFEILSIFYLAYLFSKNMIKIKRNNEIKNYESLDLIIIFLSIFQIYLMFFSLTLNNNYGFSILQEISKFTQNIIICGCLLFQICLWQKYPIAIIIIKNYVYIFTTFNILILICSFLFEYSFLEKNFCFSIILKILPIIAFVFNVFMITMAIYNNYREQYESNKRGGMINENDNLAAIIDKYSTSLQKMRKYYLIFIIYFTVSYIVDLYFKFSSIKYEVGSLNEYNVNNSSEISPYRSLHELSKNHIKFDDSSDTLKKNYNVSLAFAGSEEMHQYNLYYKLGENHILSNIIVGSNEKQYEEIKNILMSSRLLIESQSNQKEKPINVLLNNNKSKYINACEYYNDLGDKYSFKELLVCFISFVFRDIGPHIYIFISLFLYKPETLSRSSSFIEI